LFLLHVVNVQVRSREVVVPQGLVAEEKELL
jgi:hypothetical protein